MRLAQFYSHGIRRLGVLVGDTVVDLALVRREVAMSEGYRSGTLDRLVQREAPLEIADFLALGQAGTDLANTAVAWVASRSAAENARLRSLGTIVPVAELTFAPTVSPSSTIFCVGFNYAAHAAEAGSPKTEHPELFMRTYDSLAGHLQPILRPTISTKLDWEAELAVVIGKPAHRVAEEDAYDYVAGYSNFNDGSVRDYQKHTPLPTSGKNFSQTGAMGPFLVTSDEVPTPQALDFTSRVDGEVMQSANTDDMVFGIATAISYISQIMYLQPGDVIATGTPAGVGFRQNPQRFLKAGETATIEFAGLGILENTVVDEVEEKK
ncbi:MAG TPA: fumarylacetoacetate hydrolase family protein [Galbitalea sp.]|jgi:2-keto-4-pentenoate hydratase/2-oxohepta-3-ene-1,7-dioic acid hydratase in catechol pathway